MRVPVLLGSDSNALSAAERFSANARALRLLGWTGMLAVLLGASDLAFAAATTIQAGGDGDFTVVATAYRHLTLLGAGGGALAISALALGVAWYRRTVGALFAAMACALLGLVALWTPDAVTALRADLPVVQQANAREVIRVVVTALGFGTYFAVIAFHTIRARVHSNGTGS